MKTQAKKKGMSKGAMIGIGVGIAAASVAAYLLFGPDGKKNRKAVKGWAVKMKGEIIEKLEKVKKLTEPVYHEIIKEVEAKYAKTKSINKKELAALAGEMRKHWKAVSKGAVSKAKSKTKKKI